MGGSAFSYQDPLCGTSCQYMSGKQTPSLTLRIGLKLSFFTKLLIRGGSGDPETSHSYAVFGLHCWGTSYDTSFLTPFSLCTLNIIVVTSSQQVSLAWCYGICCPSFLSSQPPASRDGWPPFLCLVLPEVSSC